MMKKFLKGLKATFRRVLERARARCLVKRDVIHFGRARARTYRESLILIRAWKGPRWRGEDPRYSRQRARLSSVNSTIGDIILF